MLDSDATWTITAADGTAVKLAGPSSFAQAATVFLLEEVTGFDSPNVRTQVTDLPEQDGAVAGNFFLGSRPITLKGKVSASTASARNVAVLSLMRALRGLRDDVTVKSQASGLPAMQITGRLDNVRVTGGYTKDFLISVVCPDPLMYSQVLNTQSGTGQVATSGVAWPIVWPASWGGGTGATVTVTATNAGNFDSYLTVHIDGPIDSPWIRNSTTGNSFYLDNLSLVTGEYVDINMRDRTVIKNDGTNLYSRVRFPDSDWLFLQPGANVLELRASSTASTATLTANWRDSWT